MSRYLTLFGFHEINRLSLRRLLRLKKMNPHVTIVPFFGVSLRMFFPTSLTWALTKSDQLDKLLEILGDKIESTRRHSAINALAKDLHEIGLELYCDFTPLGYYNLDLAILNWFSHQGKNFDFEFLIFYEWDMFATKTIAELYDKYTVYDACFIEYSEPTPSWHWYNHPPGSLRSILRWLKDRGLDTTLHGCLFGANMVSRRVMTALDKMHLPYGHCEMRFPTIITNLGFSCGPLDFPMANRYKRPVSKSLIERCPDQGLFHPVYDDLG